MPEIVPDSEPDHTLVIYNVSDESEKEPLAALPQSAHVPPLSGQDSEYAVEDEQSSRSQGQHPSNRDVAFDTACDMVVLPKISPPDPAPRDEVAEVLVLSDVSVSSPPVKVLDRAYAYKGHAPLLHLQQRELTPADQGAMSIHPGEQGAEQLLNVGKGWAEWSEANAQPLWSCPYCQEAWTSRKTTKAKITHLTRCSRPRAKSKGRPSLPKECSSNRRPLATLKTLNRSCTRTAPMGDAVSSMIENREPRKRARQVVHSTLLPAEENEGLFLKRAERLLDEDPFEAWSYGQTADMPCTQDFEPSRLHAVSEDRVCGEKSPEQKSLWARAALQDCSFDGPQFSDAMEGSMVPSEATRVSTLACPKEHQTYSHAAQRQFASDYGVQNETMTSKRVIKHSLTRLVAAHMSRNAPLWQRVLLYEPLEINHLLSDLHSDAQLKDCSIKDLTQCLDDLSVCFWNAKTASKRRQRRHK